MTHDQLKSAIRARMAETGEPYMVARRECLRQRETAGGQPIQPGARQPGTTAILRGAAAAQQAAASIAASAAGLGEVVAAHHGALSLAGDSADLTGAQRDAARQAAADLTASAAGLGEVIAAHQAAFELSGDPLDLEGVEQAVAAARQITLDLAHSSAGFTGRPAGS